MRYFKDFFGDLVEWGCIVARYWQTALGGGCVFAVVDALYHFMFPMNVAKPMEVAGLLFSCFAFAAFAAWREEHKKFLAAEGKCKGDEIQHKSEIIKLKNVADAERIKLESRLRSDAQKKKIGNDLGRLKHLLVERANHVGKMMYFEYNTQYPELPHNDFDQDTNAILNSIIVFLRNNFSESEVSIFLDNDNLSIPPNPHTTYESEKWWRVLHHIMHKGKQLGKIIEVKQLPLN
jgi:hypothetical protein